MVVLGVVLVLLALAVGVLLVAGTASLQGSVDLAIPGGTLTLSPLTVLVLGMAVVAVVWLGWVLLLGGLRRGHRRRVEAREAAQAAEAKKAAEEQRLKEEFAARERQLIEERKRHESEAEALRRQAVAPDTPDPTDRPEGSTVHGAEEASPERSAGGTEPPPAERRDERGGTTGS